MPRMKFCKCGKIIPEKEICSCKAIASKARNKYRAQQKPEEKKFFNSTKWKKLRLKVIKEDGATCQRCLIKFNFIETRNLQAHHIKPRIKYDELKFERSNLITLCQSCNTHLGIKEELDFEWEYKEDVWEPVL